MVGATQVLRVKRKRNQEPLDVFGKPRCCSSALNDWDGGSVKDSSHLLRTLELTLHFPVVSHSEKKVRQSTAEDSAETLKGSRGTCFSSVNLGTTVNY
jgi:hypothetical protein